MFTVFTERDGQPYAHHVKALQIIWNHFPQLLVYPLLDKRADFDLLI